MKFQAPFGLSPSKSPRTLRRAQGDRCILQRAQTTGKAPLDTSRVIEMAWEGRTAFEAIEFRFWPQRVSAGAPDAARTQTRLIQTVAQTHESLSRPARRAGPGWRQSPASATHPPVMPVKPVFSKELPDCVDASDSRAPVRAEPNDQAQDLHNATGAAPRYPAQGERVGDLRHLHNQE